MDWGSDADVGRFIRSDNNLSNPYNGPSIVVLPLPTQLHTLPSPLPVANLVNSQLSSNAHSLATADLFVEDMERFLSRVADRVGDENILGVRNAISVMYDLLHLHRNSASAKCANLATVENEATLVRLSYGGRNKTLFEMRLHFLFSTGSPAPARMVVTTIMMMMIAQGLTSTSSTPNRRGPRSTVAAITDPILLER